MCLVKTDPLQSFRNPPANVFFNGSLMVLIFLQGSFLIGKHSVTRVYIQPLTEKKKKRKQFGVDFLITFRLHLQTLGHTPVSESDACVDTIADLMHNAKLEAIHLHYLHYITLAS